MILIYIKDKPLLTKIVTYLDNKNIEYTTDINTKYKYAIVAQIDKKSLDIIENHKTIFIAYLEENKIYNKFKKDIKYQNKIIDIFNKCNNVVFSMEYFKNLFKKIIKSKITIIHKEIIQILYNKKNITIKKPHYIVVFDSNYDNIELMISLSNKYDYKFYYVGFNILKNNKMPDNVIKIKSYDYNSYINLVKNSYMVIDFNKNNIDIKYIQIPILLRKHFIINDIPYYEKYLIPSKDVYFFDNEKTLFNKIDKINNKRLSNLTDDAYLKIIKDSKEQIALKYSLILK